jgi:hypothetical protein
MLPTGVPETGSTTLEDWAPPLMVKTRLEAGS